MAIVYKCDRCGKTYDGDETTSITNTMANKKSGNIKLIKRYDLCSGCVTDFIKFVKNEKFITNPSLNSILKAVDEIHLNAPTHYDFKAYLPLIYKIAEERK